MTTAPEKPRRLHDLDALRGFAMLLGIALHAALAFIPGFWAVQDSTASFRFADDLGRKAESEGKTP